MSFEGIFWHFVCIIFVCSVFFFNLCCSMLLCFLKTPNQGIWSFFPCIYFGLLLILGIFATVLHNSSTYAAKWTCTNIFNIRIHIKVVKSLCMTDNGSRAYFGCHITITNWGSIYLMFRAFFTTIRIYLTIERFYLVNY